LAYLVLNEVGEPMHFKKITEVVSERFGIEANVATMHNELIKDSRFILVGRGQYGLSS
jgi:DNA-directed RNA polymerase delta subunit